MHSQVTHKATSPPQAHNTYQQLYQLTPEPYKQINNIPIMIKNEEKVITARLQLWKGHDGLSSLFFVYVSFEATLHALRLNLKGQPTLQHLQSRKLIWN